MINIISNLVLPLLVLFVIVYGVFKKINVYDVFIEGAKESFDMIISMFPSILAMILGINLFINSNFLNYMFEILNPIISLIKIPVEVLPLAIMRPISGSSALALLNNILESYGPDGFIGVLASVIQGSTDTTFYVLTLYFGSIGIKKIKYAMWAGLISDLIGIVTAFIIVSLFFAN